MLVGGLSVNVNEEFALAEEGKLKDQQKVVAIASAKKTIEDEEYFIGPGYTYELIDAD